MKVTLKQLLVFKTIYQEGQISKAAKQLHMSVPAVSMALKELESVLESRLFQRTGSGLQLNGQGELLLPYANEMLTTGEKMEQVFSASASGVSGTLTIGACKTAGNYALSRLLPVFHKRFPSTQLRLVIKDSNSVERMLVEREVDLAFVDAKPSLPSIASAFWLKDRICIVCGAANPLAHKVMTTELLSQQVWYLDESATVSRVRAIQLLHSCGIVPSQNITMTTLGAIKRATATGYGVSVLPYMAIDAELARGDLVELSLDGWDFERNYWMICRADGQVSPVSCNFKAFAVDNSDNLRQLC
ncbi:LysR family transcriptional regulator [Shewanella yunxiaonensis]|uniref:LysR family transcriptional regulator n=1 Tax=Shewanella yunxiaonensis TaxID=2829809 RepID=A0ABX7YQS9_9GAMM|nr:MULTISPECIES: LysR family transcriptional regulator [Shewanella]MDF0533829.1 LysR family transcriptional regulator [Shewanella sp. A32]QUN05020.1 LysR family transcriptional regulator [Shewanella yunxiaonensis]